MLGPRPVPSRSPPASPTPAPAAAKLGAVAAARPRVAADPPSPPVTRGGEVFGPGNRETVFLSPPIRGQPRNGVSVTPRSPFSVMGDRPSSVGGEERSLSVGGDLGKKCNMLIYPSRYRGGDPRGCVLELIGFPVSQSGGPQGSFRASRHLQAPQMESGGPQGSNRVCRPSGVSRCLEALLDP